MNFRPKTNLCAYPLFFYIGQAKKSKQRHENHWKALFSPKFLQNRNFIANWAQNRPAKENTKQIVLGVLFGKFFPNKF